MKLIIQIQNSITSVKLLEGQKVIDQIVLEEINHLSDLLLPKIDQLLQENKLTLADIQKIDSELDIPETFTSSRIVEAVVKGLTLKLK
jgi:tRNA A37 threonylcarbamoyladenosine modification protein TsaB